MSVNYFELAMVALTMELDEMQRTGLDVERLARAESYLAALDAKDGESFD